MKYPMKVDEKTIKNIHTMIDYMWDDEAKHFEGCQDELSESQLKKHIFVKINQVAKATGYFKQNKETRRWY